MIFEALGVNIYEMKTTFTLLLFFVFTSLFCQMPPVVGTPTLLPSTPSSTDNVKIITETTTAYYGTRINVSQSVDQIQKKIKLEGCYSTSMLPATRTYIDTFNLGFLQAGLYSVEFFAYESAATQSCITIASSSVAISMVVNGATTSILEGTSGQEMSVSPNPFSNYISLQGLKNPAEIELRSSNGLLLVRQTVNASEEVNLSLLPPGIYFLQILSDHVMSVSMLVKIEHN